MIENNLFGLVELTNQEYHAAAGISKSGLDLIHRSPRHYWQRYLSPDRAPSHPTPAMVIGTATHSAILEPVDFAATYIKAPQFDRRTKAGREQYAAFEEENPEKIGLAPDVYQDVILMREAVRQHPAASMLLQDGLAEQSVFWRDPLTGVLCKIRPDWMPEGRPIIVDVKTTDDASPEGFAKSILNFRYHVQAAWYLDGWNYATREERAGFVFIAVEKKPPYAVAVYVLDAAAVAAGRDEYRANLDAYARCLATDEWPAYSPKIESLSLPIWALKRLMADQQ